MQEVWLVITDAGHELCMGLYANRIEPVDFFHVGSMCEPMNIGKPASSECEVGDDESSTQ